jgi:molybdopterin/thiamine biosynthesis adenylyltransferase
MFDERYSRQILFREIGAEGQARLAKSRVLLVGCGALGSVIAEVLVRAGVGHITLVDRDYIDSSNLQRQSLYTEADCRGGLPKAVAAVRHLKEINSSVDLAGVVEDVRASTISGLVSGKDLILDGTDNFETRYLLNDAGLKWGIPWTYGACVGAYGVCMTIIPGVTPCLRCVMRQLPSAGSSPTCDTVGVIGPVVHLVAAFETAEALKILTGQLEDLNRNLVAIDLWENRLSAVNVRNQRDPACPACGEGRYEFLSGEREMRAETLCGRNAVQIWANQAGTVDLLAIADRLGAVGSVTANTFLVKADLGDREVAVFRDGRAIVRGTQDTGEARRLYSRFVGN